MYQMDQDQPQLKIIVLGNTSAGKSSLIFRQVDGKFNENNVSTVGVDFRIIKNFQIRKARFNIAIWDTAGQEHFQSIVKFSCKGADGAIICFDMSNKKDIESISVWLDLIQENCPEHTQTILVGTKRDLVEQVDEEHITRNGKGLEVFYTSAKNNQGVQEMFHKIFNLAAKAKEGTLLLEAPDNRSRKVTLQQNIQSKQMKGKKKEEKNCQC